MKKFELKEELNRGEGDSIWLKMFKRWTVAVKLRRECKTVKFNIFRVCAHQGRFLGRLHKTSTVYCGVLFLFFVFCSFCCYFCDEKVTWRTLLL